MFRRARFSALHRLLSVVCALSLLATLVPYPPSGVPTGRAEASTSEHAIPSTLTPGGQDLGGRSLALSESSDRPGTPSALPQVPPAAPPAQQLAALSDVEEAVDALTLQDEVAVLPDKPAQLLADGGAVKVSFPEGSADRAVGVSFGKYHHLADRPLPDGRWMAYYFTLEGSVIGTGESIGRLDRYYDLSLTLDAQSLPAGATLYYWNNSTLKWEILPATVSWGSISAKANALTDFAIGVAFTQPTSASSLRASPEPSRVETLTSGSDVVYVGGYLGHPAGTTYGRIGAELASGTWRMTHPGNLGAMVRQLVRAPDGTFYAVEWGGSLYRSEDAAVWTRVYTGSAKGQVSNLTIDGDTLYAAMYTGIWDSIQAGVYKSTDRGDTWTRIFQSPNGGLGYYWRGKSINVSSADPNVMWFVGTRTYVAYGTDRVWVSTDGGASWTSRYEIRGAIQQVIPDPVDASVAYMIRDVEVLKTTDQGASWTQVLNAGVNGRTFQDFVVDPSNNQKLWFARGSDGIERSTDGGASWTHIRVLPAGVVDGMIATLVRDRDGRLYSGVDGNPRIPWYNVFKSTDEGDTWQDLTGDMREAVNGGYLHDSFGPMKVLTVLPEAPAPDQGRTLGLSCPTHMCADPVNSATGNFVYQHEDLHIPGRGLSLVVRRAYNSKDASSGPFGYGWTFNYGARLTEEANGMVTLVDGDGRRVRFTRKDDGTYFAPPGARSTLTRNLDGTFTLVLRDQTTLSFDASGKLASIVDKNANQVTLSYTDGRLTSVTDASNRSITFGYNPDGTISQITDPLNRAVVFGYTDGDLTSVTDMNGETTIFTYSDHRMLTVADPNGHTVTTNSYDGEGRVTSQQDARLGTTTFSYNPIAATTTITDARGSRVALTYDAAYRTLSEQDALGKTESYSWDVNDNKASVTDRNGKTTKFAYDAMGNLLAAMNPLGDARNYAYDSKNNPTAEWWTLSNPQNMVANHSFEVDDNGDRLPDSWKSNTWAGGPMTSSQDTSERRYGLASLKVTAANQADATVSSYLIPVSPNTTYALSYDVKTLSVTVTTAAVYGAMFVTEYNSSAAEGQDLNTNLVRQDTGFVPNVSGTTDWSRKAGTFTTAGNTAYVRVRASLGNFGKAAGTAWFDGVMLERGNTASAYSRGSSYGYDAKGNLASVTDALGKVTTFGYDGYGNQISVTDPLSRTVSFGYDAHGNRTRITDGAGKDTLQGFDLVGRVITRTNPLSHTVSFAYDNENRLLSATDALGNETSYGYDAVGNRTVITDANGLATHYGYDQKNNLKVVTDTLGSVTTYGYDANDNRTSVTDALNRTTTYQFDAVNRLIRVTDPLSNTTSYGYDAVGNRTVITDANGIATSYAYDAVNRLTQITYPDSQVKYAYDVLNNRTAMTDTLGTTLYAYDEVGRPITITTPSGLAVGYGYNDAGQRSSLTYPDGKQVQYDYDAAGRLWTVEDWASRVVTYTYDDAGRLTGAQLPNDTSASYTYDDADRLTNLTHTSVVSGTIDSFAYELDRVGNRRVMTDTTGVTAYVYDDLYRLTQVTYPDSSVVSYGYDAVGNRLAMTDTVGTTSYTYDAADRMQSAGDTTFTWDANGNMRTRVTPSGTITYTYDYANRLTQVGTDADTYQYAYDGDGIRVRKTVDGTPTDYLWDKALSLPVVLTDTNALYLHGLGLIAQESGVGISYYHPDGLGTIRNLTDSTGQVIVGYEYDAFGGLRSS